jgi:hypothetical protein
MKNEKQVTMKNGRRAVSGTCSVCGTKMFRIGGGGSGTSSSRTASVPVAKQRPKVKAASRKPTSKTSKTRKSKTKGKR